LFAYGSLQGILEITRSTPDRVAGHFDFTAAEYSASWQPDGRRGSGTPANLDSTASRVAVRGTFSATPVGEGAPSPRVHSVDDTTSLLLWYAHGVVRETPSRQTVIFVFAPGAAPDSSAARRIRELRRGGLNVIESGDQPGPDTLLVHFGPLTVDSVTSKGTFYLLAVYRFSCDRDHDGSQALETIKARCDRRTCTSLGASSAGTAMRC
ncbi:MAG: hypothetical protein ABI877_15500, partial [Gemmatimonadaceae bacterium]